MDYERIREILHQHFKERLEKRKQDIAKEGRLSELDVTALRNSRELSKEALEQKDYTLVGTDGTVDRFAAHYELSLTQGSKEYELFRTEMLRAHRDYCEALLASDLELDKYDYRTLPHAHARPAKKGKLLLAAAIDDYCKEKARLKQWSQRSLMSNRSYFMVLTRYLGQDAPLAISDDIAKDVKSMLIRLPKHANKKPELKGKSIDELLLVEGVERLNAVSVNKHLSTYASFYAWALKRRDVEINPFSDLTDNVRKAATHREPFYDAEARQILDKVHTVKKPHHKWGVLVAFYTGARLNEIASLEKRDIKQVDGVWCIDINEDGEKKRLKNESSARVLPIHPKLMEAGFLNYVEAQSQGRIFKELEFHPKDGYGRAIGRWFNDSLLRKQLGITSTTKVFHSIRHTVAQKLRNLGVEEATIKDILGHRQTSVAMDVYARKLDKKVMLAALSKLNYQMK